MSERAFERFVRKIHRRLVLTRAAENLGICISIGCGIALPVLAVLLWRDLPVFLFLCLVGSVCFLAACALTIHRWPSVLDAAAEADRQLDLDDLLTTALRMGGIPSDGMAGSVLAVADAKCERMLPAAVILNRYGVAAWGGIALALAAVVAVSLIPTHPIRSAEAEEERSILNDGEQTPGQSVLPRLIEKSNTDPVNEESNRMTSATETGTGGQLASAHNSMRSVPMVESNLERAGDPSAGTAAGDGASHDSRSAAGEVSGLGTRTVHRTIGPWQSSGRNVDARTGEATGENVPAGDRDLVGLYFDRN